MLPERETQPRYYVYSAYGIDETFVSSASAVNLAYQISGVVVDERGNRVWLKGSRASKNKIMAISCAS